MWGEALAAKLRAAGTDLAALEAERIAALWKTEAPLKALQERAEQLQGRTAAVEKQVWLKSHCIRTTHAVSLLKVSGLESIS